MRKIALIFPLVLSLGIAQEFSVSTTSELRSALVSSQDNSESDIITLAKGIYSTATDGLGTFVFDSNQTYDLEIKALESLKSSDVIISGNSANRVFTIKNRGKLL